MGNPWLTIIGIGEDGLAGLSEASRKALGDAEMVFGGQRHLALAGVTDHGRPWPVPFDTDCVLACRGRPTAVLASGDPFWYGVGTSLAQKLPAGEWIAHSAPSTFSLAAARLGWRLETVTCLGFHAAPFECLVPHLAREARIICLVRDGKAAGDLAEWLTARGWGESRLWTLTALGGPRESVTPHRADSYTADPGAGLVAIALEASGSDGLSRSSGLPDTLFVHEGQITKRPMRALALSALGPKPGERLWDIGAGSGSISVEWALCGGTAIAVEARADRAANIRSNTAAFGLTHRIRVVEGTAPDILSGLERPQAAFMGGGLDAAMFDAVWSLIGPGTRIVAHAVTLETEALLSDLHQRHGGELMRVEIAHAGGLGRYRSWEAARPVVQWSVVR
ncbi:precorrin-6y C5,15-methyltransferase (decarboxylating) subunit CbiE [Bradyrhizobium sp. CSA112]|uniref:precorrin-6y C5,15-methyltransferase (decarboxylating) subunit CbiE n=1 Tax=Bradyrhizobium sp. CSA112 TaxID=2699170 RepID=UPI0023AED473|nr:precorrin-6y C5,15-methyltransferase (decarboxylating) subunit CbiE [Bradyrhizobium sp. CSA112]MDE5458205.1 precorrin-6y C5,15-methyltransferase (decarboxylating) subunit CbiE [Bradyrhizobium sp. CSA112]